MFPATDLSSFLLFADAAQGTDDGEAHELLRHLESMYTLAQVLTLDADQAARLVEETYLAALDAGAVEGSDAVDRSWLFARMRAIHAGQQEATVADAAAEADGEKPRLFAHQHNIKQRLVDPFLRNAAPVAFASLEERDRMILMLCDAERMSCADAGRILGEAGEVVCRQLDFARSAFQFAVVSQASPMIRDLLNTFDREEWVPSTLRRAIKAEFGNVPPTLEPSIKATLNAPPILQALAHEAADREAKSHTSREDVWIGRFKRFIAPIMLIVTAGLVGYIGSEVLIKPADPNVITLAVRHVDKVSVAETTEVPEEAERFIQDRLNWKLHVPTIENATLVGAGTAELAHDVFVPAFVYADGDAADRLVVYAFTYALLDRYADRLFLERNILTAIADDSHFDLYSMSDEHKIVIWRRADDIFLAVTTSDPTALKDRIQRP
ncbi:MAG: hypothetical protein R2834_07175 [Rhodothermales bacterium]